MKQPWFKTESVEESFFENAPVRLSETFEINRPAAEIWDDLTGEHPLGWCRIIGETGINWTSERPFGVGTTRSISALKGVNRFREHFFIWEEGRRHAFYVLESSTPMVKRFAEDYQVEPVTETSCRFTWTVAYEPSLIGKLGEPINKRLLKSLFADTHKHYGG